MNCPKCNHIMKEIDFESITIDRCVNCRGIWFDNLEADQMKKLKGSEIIDSGDEKRGKSFDTIREISCPHCKIAMAVFKDPKKDKLCYETCPKCHGIFMDAGEFKKFKSEQSLLDRLVSLFS